MTGGIRALDWMIVIAYLVANYVVTFGLDLAPWSGKPHLLLYGLCGMVVCLLVASLASRLASQGVESSRMP